MSGGRFGSASGIRRTINATLPPFYVFPADYSKSPSPYPRPPRKAHQRGAVFCAHPSGRSPQANAGFQKVGERGASAAKQKLKPSGSSDWISGRGSAVRFGPASWASLVIEFCQQGEFYRLAEKFVSCCMLLPDGKRASFAGEAPSLAAFLNAAFVGGPSVLSQTRKQRSAFSEPPFSAGRWVVEATSE